MNFTYLSLKNGNGSNMHEETFARSDTFARRHFCKKKLLHEGSFLHDSKKIKVLIKENNKKLIKYKLIKTKKKITDRG